LGRIVNAAAADEAQLSDWRATRVDRVIADCISLNFFSLSLCVCV
jgi:hypothetical protein